MDRTPRQLLDYFLNSAVHNVIPRSNRRYSIFKGKKMIINQLIPDDPHPPGCNYGYLNTKYFDLSENKKT